ncbi:MAG TPA: PEP-CTERM sorting domain-containing protein, partial [Tepidisphaeraceae bacterium]|nr:PEP-CTERM sorting domain-containing protein [Tepidisphaeraceae bacterium]
SFRNGAVGTSPIFYQANAGGTTLGFGALVGSIADGTVIPNVFDPGLSESFLLADLTVSGTTNGPAANQVTFAVVPEPGALAPVILGGLALIRRRRR